MKAAKIPNLEIGFLIAAAFVASSVGADERETVVDIPLGEKLSIPQCTLFRTGVKLSYEDPWPSYDLDSKQPVLPCWQMLRGSASKPGEPLRYQGQEIVGIAQAPDRLPRGVREQVVELSDGVVRTIVLHTAGAAWQQEIYSLLESKYGSPKVKLVVPKTNLLGTKIEGIVAQWSRGALAVEFRGVTNDVAWGRVDVTETSVPSMKPLKNEPAL